MSESVEIDNAVFRKRVSLLQRKISDGEFNGASSLLVLIGKDDEENSFAKSAVIHTWLLGYEFPMTAMAITKDKTFIVTSARKKSYLEPIEKGGNGDVTILTRGAASEAEKNKEVLTKLADLISATGNTKVGVFPKDSYKGALINEWNDLDAPKKWEHVDVSLPVARAMEVKDEEELRAIRNASKASTGMMTDYFADNMSTIIDEDKKITHLAFAEKVEKKIDDDKFFNSRKKEFQLGSDFDASHLDWCYQPTIQSAGSEKFDLRAMVPSDEKRLLSGIILCSLGLRYKSYCANIARTYLIDPSKKQEEAYRHLFALQQKVFDAIKEGATCKEVYNAAIKYIKDKAPEYESHFLRNVGWGIGIDFRDASLLLNGKNDTVLRDGMTLNVQVGFNNLEDGGKKYSIVLADTLRVTGDGNIVFTESPHSAKDVIYYIKNQGDSSGKSTDKSKIKAERLKKEAAALLPRTRLRGEAKAEEDASNEKRRQLHQQELHERLQKAGLSKYTAAEAGELVKKDTKAVFKKFESYKRDTQLPNYTKDLRIHVDTRAQTILIPINGRPVPFHINSYKNGSKNEEGDYVYLRLNFNTPSTTQANSGDDILGGGGEVPYEDSSATFIRSISLRSRDSERMHDVFKKITDLKKEAVKRESERKEMADVVEQGQLQVMKTKRPLRLESVNVRPGPEGKRVQGSLEIHQNGVRYQSPISADHRIDILFSNVAHLFFQPCDQELISLVHFHLKNPIIVGKKKTKDVQFFREASEMSVDETGNSNRRRYRYGDEDELEQEQEERRQRAALNKEFKRFAEQIAEQSNGKVDVDIPFRELGFSGVPFKANVLCQPTTECLVQLIDPPFLVISLSEVEIVHLERVSFGLRNFDMVFVYKDYTRPVTHINTIPMSQLDSVKDWLNEMDLPYFEGNVNLNWTQIMKTVLEDPHEFFAGAGGWKFLDNQSDSEEEEEEEESEFEVSDDNPSDEEEEESDYGSEDESDYSDAEEEEEEGEDWDDLEEKAAQADARKGGV